MGKLRTIKNIRRKHHFKKVIAETVIVSTLMLSILPFSAHAASKTFSTISFEETFIGKILLVNELQVDNNARNLSIILEKE